jgi:hypothetical protein
VGEDGNKKEGKGFSGLSSLIADGQATSPAPPPKLVAADTSVPVKSTGARNEPLPPPPPPAAQRPTPQSQSNQRQAGQGSVPPHSDDSSGVKWVLGIIAVIGVVWLFGRSNEENASSSTAYSTSAQSQVQSDSSFAQPLASTRPEESKPPLGQNRVLSLAQIRYCLAEGIRMDGAESNVGTSSQTAIDRFNELVADYNSRCGRFRYQRGSLEAARRDVDQYRAQLLLEGRNRFNYSRLPSDTQSGEWAVAEASPAPVMSSSPVVVAREPTRKSRTRPPQMESGFASVERSDDGDSSRALESLSQAHANEARQRAASERISSTPGAQKRWDYKTGRDIWVDANGNPIE